MLANRRPFGSDDAVGSGVAQHPVGGAHVRAQDTVLLGTQPFDCAAALMVEKMRAEFYGYAVQRLKSMGQQQQFAFRVDARTLR